MLQRIVPVESLKDIRILLPPDTRCELNLNRTYIVDTGLNDMYPFGLAVVDDPT
jgi:hypothetical protein